MGRCWRARRGSCGSLVTESGATRAERDRRLGGARADVATLGEGIDLALANKESLVVGGELVTQLAEATGAQIIPVDSEHSALHQLLAGSVPGTVDSADPDRLGGRSGAGPHPSSRTSRSSRRWRTRPGRWAARSRSTRRR
jgi:hypothetical protein